MGKERTKPSGNDGSVSAVEAQRIKEMNRGSQSEKMEKDGALMANSTISLSNWRPHCSS